jgi:hypothetical protein
MDIHSTHLEVHRDVGFRVNSNNMAQSLPSLDGRY